MKALVAVTSLLLSTALLLIGQGMQLTLVPLRASDNGLSDFLIGVSASCYFIGFIVGCIGIPATIARAGHIRSFSVLTAVMIRMIIKPATRKRFLNACRVCPRKVSGTEARIVASGWSFSSICRATYINSDPMVWL